MTSVNGNHGVKPATTDATKPKQAPPQNGNPSGWSSDPIIKKH